MHKLLLLLTLLISTNLTFAKNDYKNLKAHISSCADFTKAQAAFQTLNITSNDHIIMSVLKLGFVSEQNPNQLMWGPENELFFYSEPTDDSLLGLAGIYYLNSVNGIEVRISLGIDMITKDDTNAPYYVQVLNTTNEKAVNTKVFYERLIANKTLETHPKQSASVDFTGKCLANTYDIPENSAFITDLANNNIKEISKKVQAIVKKSKK